MGRTSGTEGGGLWVAATGGGVYELGDAVVLGGVAASLHGGRLRAGWRRDGREWLSQERRLAAAGPLALTDQVASTLDFGLGRHRLELGVEGPGGGTAVAWLELEVVEPGGPTLAPLARPALVWPDATAHPWADVWIQSRALDRGGRALPLAVQPEGEACEVREVDAARGLVHLRLACARSTTRRHGVELVARDAGGRQATARVELVAPPALPLSSRSRSAP